MTNLILRSGALRIVFEQKSDRLAHRIELLIGEEFEPLLESVEGTGSEDWPASPPLQSLHFEERPGGNVALLVGMAGVSHWSASIAADEAANRLIMEVACRAKEEPITLGSRYRWLNYSRAFLKLPPETDDVLLVDTSVLYPILISPLPSTEIIEQRDMVKRDGQIDIISEASTGPLPRTLCWGYSIQLLPSPQPQTP